MSEREEVSLLSIRNEEDVSPECLAWADSCIISFPEDSDNNANWGTFRDALTEIIDIHPEMFVASSTGGPNAVSPDEVMTEPADSSSEEVSEIISMLRFESDPVRNSLQDQYFPDPTVGKGTTRGLLDNASKDLEGVERIEAVGNWSSEEVSEIISMLRFESDPVRNSLRDQYFPESTGEKGTTRGPLDNASKDLEGVERIGEDRVSSDGEVEEEEAELLSSQVFKDDFMNASVQDNVDDLNVAEEPVKVTPQEIFKVWDLEIAGDDDDEEDGLVLQLKKALDQPRPLNDDHVVAAEMSSHDVAAEMSSVEDLIARISDMSLVETLSENAEV